MAHFAKLDHNDYVIDINVVHNWMLLDSDGHESEALGIEFLVAWSGGHTNWRQTSYNGNFRKRYAHIGGTYHREFDAFIPPKPYASWILNETTCLWQAPVVMPTDGNLYRWNEINQSWDQVKPVDA